MRMARVVQSSLAPHTKAAIDANDFLLFPDDAHDVPEDVDSRERQWMLKLNRSAG